VASGGYASRFVFLGDGAGSPGDPVPADVRLYVDDEMSALAEFTFDPALPGDPDDFLETRRYLYGTELIAAETGSAGSQSPAPKSQAPPASPRFPDPCLSSTISFPSAPRST